MRCLLCRYSLFIAGFALALEILGLYRLREAGVDPTTRMFWLALGMTVMFYFVDRGLWHDNDFVCLRIVVNAVQGAALGLLLGYVALGDELDRNYFLLLGLLVSFVVTTVIDMAGRLR